MSKKGKVGQWYQMLVNAWNSLWRNDNHTPIEPKLIVKSSRSQRSRKELRKLRRKAMAMLARGAKFSVVMKKLDVSSSTLWAWQKHYRAKKLKARQVAAVAKIQKIPHRLNPEVYKNLKDKANGVFEGSPKATLKVIADDLGVPPSTIYRWKEAWKLNKKAPEAPEGVQQGQDQIARAASANGAHPEEIPA